MTVLSPHSSPVSALSATVAFAPAFSVGSDFGVTPGGNLGLAVLQEKSEGDGRVRAAIRDKRLVEKKFT